MIHSESAVKLLQCVWQSFELGVLILIKAVWFESQNHHFVNQAQYTQLDHTFEILIGSRDLMWPIANLHLPLIHCNTYGW